MQRIAFDDEHHMYRDTVRRFIAQEIVPNDQEWEDAGAVDRDLFRKAAAQGLLAMQVPEQHGGLGLDDFRFNQIVGEEVGVAGVIGSGTGITLHTDVVLPYILELATDEQRDRWLPGIADGTLITALGLTEPGMGSDLAGMGTSALATDAGYQVNGSKTFITNGINADLVVTAVKTDPAQRHRGISLLVLERGMDGFERGRNLQKIGMHAQDTAELFFNDVKIPKTNVLGDPTQGFKYLTHFLAEERLANAVQSITGAQVAWDITLDFVKQRRAFGKPLAAFQNTRFKLAELRTQIDVVQAFVDQSVTLLNAGKLTADIAAEAKLVASEVEGRTVDECLQLFGGAGYMDEYRISRLYADARIGRIYAGTSEIMKEIIARGFGLDERKLV